MTKRFFASKTQQVSQCAVAANTMLRRFSRKSRIVHSGSKPHFVRHLEETAPSRSQTPRAGELKDQTLVFIFSAQRQTRQSFYQQNVRMVSFYFTCIRTGVMGTPRKQQPCVVRRKTLSSEQQCDCHHPHGESSRGPSALLGRSQVATRHQSRSVKRKMAPMHCRPNRTIVSGRIPKTAVAQPRSALRLLSLPQTGQRARSFAPRQTKQFKTVQTPCIETGVKFLSQKWQQSASHLLTRCVIHLLQQDGKLYMRARAAPLRRQCGKRVCSDMGFHRMSKSKLTRRVLLHSTHEVFSHIFRLHKTLCGA